jgi:hypothetical protein
MKTKPPTQAQILKAIRDQTALRQDLIDNKNGGEASLGAEIGQLQVAYKILSSRAVEFIEQ